MTSHRLLRTLLSTAALLLLVNAPVYAAQITVAWDPNTEPDIAGYIVEYGPSSNPFTSSIDVGNVTTWTYTSAVDGTSYCFRVSAYNTSGLSSAPSVSVCSGPPIVADRASLVFGVVQGTPQIATPSQTIHLNQTGTAAATWTVSSGAAWLQVSPTSGSGSAALTISLVTAALPPASTSTTITVTLTGASNTVIAIPVKLNIISPSATAAPFGSFDTPQDNLSGVTGSLAITGWALDDVAVTGVRLYRDPVAGETPGSLVYIGNATFVDDARSDVAAAYPQLPHSYRGGWGYLALTNMLPSGGNGTFRFYAYADDADGHTSLLGTRTFTCSNATATAPFGSIDTPAPGETIFGTSYANYGWVLANGTARADVPGGGTVTVLIDGVAVGSPAGWTSRSDLPALFPNYSGIGTAAAAYVFDTTQLTDGVHTISWVLTDSLGRSAGIGSRFFRVFNAAVSLANPAVTASAAAMSLLQTTPAESIDSTPVEARRGFALDTEFSVYEADANGVVSITAEEVDRIELKTHAATEAYLRVGSDVRPLPPGSNLNSETGVFTWQPPAGFVGPYDFTFLRHGGSGIVRQNVRIVLVPKGS